MKLLFIAKLLFYNAELKTKVYRGSLKTFDASLFFQKINVCYEMTVCYEITVYYETTVCYEIMVCYEITVCYEMTVCYKMTVYKRLHLEIS